MNKALPRREAETLAAETLETELAHIAALSLDDLRALWLKMTGQGAPRALSRELVARMIAHRIQEQRLGKLAHLAQLWFSFRDFAAWRMSRINWLEGSRG